MLSIKSKVKVSKFDTMKIELNGILDSQINISWRDVAWKRRL